MKIYGERGSPCLILWVGVIIPCASPFKRIEYVTEVMHRMIHHLQSSCIPSRFKIAFTKFHSSRSYALLMSVLTAMAQCFVAPDRFKQWSASCVIMMLSAIALPGMKADWFSEIIVSSTGCSHLVSIFDMIL